MTVTFEPASATGGYPVLREVLPLCYRLSTLEDRVALYHDNFCRGSNPDYFHFRIVAAPIVKWGPSAVHPEISLPFRFSCEGWEVDTDDPVEAETAWERAERWVRTGELDA